MIVYNVERRWFTLKSEAEAYRVGEGLKRAATAKIEVGDRSALAALLNALCQPGSAVAAPAPAEVLERASVPAGISVPDCVPDFLLNDAELRTRRAAERAVQS